MSDFPVHPVPQQWSNSAWIDDQAYQTMYRQSVENPEQFWARSGRPVFNLEYPLGRCL